MKQWEIKYNTPNAGAEREQRYVIEAQQKSEAENLFKIEFPLEQIISVQEVKNK